MIRILATLVLLAGPSGAPLATCTGSSSCRACKSCSSCKHCHKEGGSCGVCKPGKPA